MRDIKFRAWDKKLERMRTVQDIRYSLGKIYSFFVQDANELGCRLYADEYVVEQFTGLYDMNGKEIYEGDIVKIEYDDMVDFPEKVKATVIFQEGGFQLESGEEADWLSYFDGHIEVIGNIHEVK